jgi:hypothetical protein
MPLIRQSSPFEALDTRGDMVTMEGLADASNQREQPPGRWLPFGYISCAQGLPMRGYGIESDAGSTFRPCESLRKA